MANIHSLQSESNDDALVHRLFDLTCEDSGDRGELDRIDALVYARLAEAYGDSGPTPDLHGSSRIAA